MEMTRAFPAPGEPHGQHFLPIQPMHSFMVNPPTFASEAHMELEVAKAGTGLGQLAQPSPQHKGISSKMLIISRGLIQAKQPTRSSHSE